MELGIREGLSGYIVSLPLSLSVSGGLFRKLSLEPESQQRIPQFLSHSVLPLQRFCGQNNKTAVDVSLRRENIHFPTASLKHV